MKTYNIPINLIEQYGPTIFQSFDRDRSGTLDISEAPTMFQQLFEYLREPQPNPQDLQFTLNKFDVNRDGKMDYQEFRKMMYFLAGKPC